MNAFVLPTKEIFVYSGLIDLLEKEEPLIAAVMAHEISEQTQGAFLSHSLLIDLPVHVTERHAVENMGFLALSSVVFDILRGISFALTISFPFVTDAIGSVFNAMNDVVAERAYSRKLETEADTLGLLVGIYCYCRVMITLTFNAYIMSLIQLMAKAGYNPESALELWGLLNMMEQDSHDGNITAERVLPFLRTHPQGESRLENIRKHLPRAVEIYQETQKPSKAQQIRDALVTSK